MIAFLLLSFFLAPAAAASSSGSPDARRAQSEYLRGTLLERRGAYGDALAAYEKALALDPNSAFIAGEAAELALEIPDQGRAEKWARRRLELAPDDPQSRLILGRVLWARGDSVEAEEEMIRALEAEPASEEAVFALVELVAVLSVNLAVFNVLPIPALDGGRMFFIWLEWARRKRLPAKMEQRVNAWGMAVLLSLLALITLQDVIRVGGIDKLLKLVRLK